MDELSQEFKIGPEGLPQTRQYEVAQGAIDAATAAATMAEQPGAA